MLFNSLQFLYFFPLVVVLYFLFNPKYRWALLLGASYYFYMCWKIEYIVLILVSTIIDYTAGWQMHKAVTVRNRRLWLILSLCSNLGILFFFKYFNFFNDNFRLLFEKFNLFYNVPAFDVLLPVGISFYTFQTLSYTIDIYNKKIKPEKHIGKFALYVAFFPQLVAGPIERASRLLPQMHKTFTFNYDRIVSGLRLMLWGFFKKVVIADRLALIVNQVYNNPGEQNALTYIIATYFFAFQIYCDFSGYSDIAIGSAKIMGYDLMKNFNVPYIARSIREFWQRWHISLSTWFRDYLYIPLGGNKVIKWRWYYNLFITFTISGLWHGANWTFIIWGALHGIYLILERTFIFKNYKKKKNAIIVGFQVIITFHLVLLSWIFFRANSLDQAVNIINIISTDLLSNLNGYLNGMPVFNGFGIYNIKIILIMSLLIGFLYVTDILQTNIRFQRLYHNSFLFRYIVYFALFYSIVFGGYFGEVQFIYFQF